MARDAATKSLVDVRNHSHRHDPGRRLLAVPDDPSPPRRSWRNRHRPTSLTPARPATTRVLQHLVGVHDVGDFLVTGTAQCRGLERPRAASRCRACKSPSRSPLRSKIPVGRFDQPARCGPVKSNVALRALGVTECREERIRRGDDPGGDCRFHRRRCGRRRGTLCQADRQGKAASRSANREVEVFTGHLSACAASKIKQRASVSYSHRKTFAETRCRPAT